MQELSQILQIEISGLKLHLHPPVAKKRGPRRQKKLRTKPIAERKGKATRQALCKGCGEYGHRQGSWRCQLTGTKKRYKLSLNFDFFHGYIMAT
jgi:hypothetical protein